MSMPVKVLLAQIAPRLGRWEENWERHREILREAAERGVDLVIFPELSLTGYMLKDFVPEVAVHREVLATWLEPMAGELEKPLSVVIGFVERSTAHRYYNAAAFLHLSPSGTVRLVHVHRKVYLPTYGMFDEMRYWRAGREFRAFEAPLLGRCGLLICEDLWHLTSPYLLSLDGPGLEGARCLIGIANSPARGATDLQRFTTANAEIWRMLNRIYALLLGCVVFHCQRVGVEDNFIFTGGSEIVVPTGETLGQAPLFEEAFLEAEVHVEDWVRRAQNQTPPMVLENVDLVLRELERIHREANEG